MQITETLSEPLRREFTVTIGAGDLDAKLTGKIAELQPKIHLKGFRPGKAPVSFLKKTYGKSLMGDIVNEASCNNCHNPLNAHGSPGPTGLPGFCPAVERRVVLGPAPPLSDQALLAETEP